jgi:Xanthine and CO dehydrogenases maturation factor, XdhC/CoxF family
MGIEKNKHTGYTIISKNAGSLHRKQVINIENNNLYRKIAERKQYQNNVLLSGIEGRYIGEKLFLSGSDIIWTSEESAGISEYVNHIADFPGDLRETGVLSLGDGRIFCEVIGNEPVMVICGGGHVSVPIIRLAKILGFYTIVLEDRPLFAEHAKNAGADEVICESFETALDRIEGTPDTYFVIVTRGHQYDTACLKLAVQKKNAYVGMMGSKKRVGFVKTQLISEGISSKLLDQVHMPIGLSIGADTPEEIAVSVMAEVIQVKNTANKSGGYTKEMLLYLTGEKGGSLRKVLATIIAKKGSGPRKAGTKMLVMEDGTFVGSVGGGSAEAKITKECLQILRRKKAAQQVFTVDMTGKEAQEDGMVCGGTMEVLLEEIE